MPVSRISTITTSSARIRWPARCSAAWRRGAGDCEPFAGKSTLNRLELSAAGFNGKKARKIVADFDRMDDLLVELLVETYEEAPQQIVLDIDATDFEFYGNQEDRFNHGYYDEYCYLLVMMFVDRHPVLVRLRTASLDAAAGIQDELEGVVGRIRAHWPETRIIVTTNSGFCSDDILAWCEDEENVDYVPSGALPQTDEIVG